MTYGVYGYRDNKFAFGPIWMDQNDEVAQRGFAFMINNREGIFNFAPADFDLFKIGTFDSETGQIESVWPIQFICNGLNVVDRAYEERKKVENEKSVCEEKD